MVVRLEWMASSLSHLLEVVERLEAKDAHFQSLRDPVDTSCLQANSAFRYWAPLPNWNPR